MQEWVKMSEMFVWMLTEVTRWCGRGSCVQQTTEWMDDDKNPTRCRRGLSIRLILAFLILIKFAGYVAWILICKRYKFGGKSATVLEILIFPKGLLIWHEWILRDHLLQVFDDWQVLWFVCVWWILFLMFWQVAPLIASFNPYVNDMWASRCAVLTRFQQAARKVFI